MKYFRSASSGAVHAYEDDIAVESDDNGVYRFTTAEGLAVDAPSDLVPCDAPATSGQSVESRKRALSAVVQRHLDEVAKGLGYDDMNSAVTYADEPAVRRFQDEGQALRAWRSLVWAACYDLLDRWSKGQLDEPNADELIASLPAFTAPA
ncbi:hypothetical protein [Variovorax paradoxus]|jgi:hypothetical protein|uniref:hypothetical protein n=1 Tax=Variovorax paradoxus TaxID=34073 RepID=UPI001ABCE837